MASKHKFKSTIWIKNVIKKTVDSGSTVKTFITRRTKLDEYRTFSTLILVVDKLKKPERVCPTRTPIRYKHLRCIKVRPVNGSYGK